MKIHTFLKKAEMLETICFTIENVVLGIEKVMKIRSKICAKSMQEKGMQKVWKMMTKGSQNGSRNPSKIGKVMVKTHAKKQRRNLRPSKIVFS